MSECQHALYSTGNRKRLLLCAWQHAASKRRVKLIWRKKISQGKEIDSWQFRDFGILDEKQPRTLLMSMIKGWCAWWKTWRPKCDIRLHGQRDMNNKNKKNSLCAMIIFTSILFQKMGPSGKMPNPILRCFCFMCLHAQIIHLHSEGASERASERESERERELRNLLLKD